MLVGKLDARLHFIDGLPDQVALARWPPLFAVASRNEPSARQGEDNARILP
jgi:hypothetical protein